MEEIFLKGKTNTEILIIVIFILLILLFAIGKILTKNNDKTTDKLDSELNDKETDCHDNGSSKSSNKYIKKDSKKEKSSKKAVSIIVAFVSLPTIISAVTLLVPTSAYAICPVCVGGVAAGLGLAKFLGIDDLITGLWLGAMLVAITMLTEEWFAKKGWLQKLGKLRLVLIALITIGSVIYPLYSLDYINFHFDHVLWGIDKLLIGPAFGMLGFVSGYFLDAQIKRNNSGKARFPFQRVIVPVGIIWLLTVAGYFILYY